MKLNYLRVLFGLCAIIISSDISYAVSALGDVPFTFQSLIVFIAAASLKPKEFLACIILYLLLGIAGVPVFAEGTSGIEKILGGSGGFLYGFAFSGYFISSYFDKDNSTSYIAILNLMIQATVILFFFGLLHLSLLYGFNNALSYGLFPFWKASLLKVLYASILIRIRYFVLDSTNTEPQ
jgi:biotin transport system substrate-specific component